MHYDGGHLLKRIHLDVADAVQIREQMHVGVVAGVVARALKIFHALGIVVSHRADHDELHARELAAHATIHVDDAQRVFPGIEPRDLHEGRTVGVHAVQRHDAPRVVVAHRRVLRTQRVDRRWDDGDLANAQIVLHVLRHSEDRCVECLHERTQETPILLIGGGHIDVAAPDPAAAVGGTQGA